MLRTFSEEDSEVLTAADDKTKLLCAVLLLRDLVDTGKVARWVGEKEMPRAVGTQFNAARDFLDIVAPRGQNQKSFF